MEIKFKNGSYIKAIDSGEAYRSSRSKIQMEDNKKKYYAGVDMTNWDFSFDKDDFKFIYKAFVAVCNFAEDLSSCADCPLNKLCFSEDGEKFWEHVHRLLAKPNHKTKHKWCLFCANSMSADAPDGTQVLVCFDCHGMENKEIIVDEDGYCRNYNE